MRKPKKGLGRSAGRIEAEASAGRKRRLITQAIKNAPARRREKQRSGPQNATSESIPREEAPASLARVELPSLKKLMKCDGPADCLEALRCQDARLQRGKYAFQTQEMVTIYAVATFLYANDDAWIAFCRHPNWNGVKLSPRHKDRGDALRFAFRFANRVGRDATRNQRCRISTRLLAFWMDGSTPVEVVKSLAKQ